MLLSALLVFGDAFTFSSLMAKSFGGGGYSKPSFSRSSNWSGPTKSTWNRSGGGIFGGSSSGYSKPSAGSIPDSKPIGSGPTGGSSGYSKPTYGSGSQQSQSPSGYFKPSLDDKPGTQYPRPSGFKTPQSSGYGKPSLGTPGSPPGSSQTGSSTSGPAGYAKPNLSATGVQKPAGVSSFDQKAIDEARKKDLWKV